jgi:dihydrofolate reductase
MSFDVILAADSHGGIARNGVIPWPRIGGDLAHFARLTAGATVVVGRLTHETMPPLPGRRVVVVTSTDIPGVECYRTLTSAVRPPTPKTFVRHSEKVFVAGGARLANEAFCHPDFRVLHLTQIDADYGCNTVIDLNWPSMRWYGPWQQSDAGRWRVDRVIRVRTARHAKGRWFAEGGGLSVFAGTKSKAIAELATAVDAQMTREQVVTVTCTSVARAPSSEG